MKDTKYFCLALAIATMFVLAAKLRADNSGATNSTSAILRHPGFREGLVWIGDHEPTDAENQPVLDIISHLSQPGWTGELEQFLKSNPTSPWAASLHYAYASFCRRTGRITKALTHWQAGWELVENETSDNGHRLGGAILGDWMEQLSSLGRRDELRELIRVGENWPFINRQNRAKFESARNNYHLMGKHPEVSFRCGTLALKAVGQLLQPTNKALESLVDLPSPTNGFSVAALARVAGERGLNLVAARRVAGQELLVPSVIHWRQNHYAAILKQANDNYYVQDPTFGHPKWLSADAINEEASGVFLVPTSAVNSHWVAIGTGEMESVRGRGLYNNVNDGRDKGCTRDFSGQKKCPPCPGMPVWWVSEPYINVWIADEPMSYLTSRGEPFTFRLTFKQRDSRPQTPINELGGAFDAGWNISWMSYIRVSATTPYVSGGPEYPVIRSAPAALYLADGGEVDFAAGQGYDQETQLMLVSQEQQESGTDNGENGIIVAHADGTQDVYGYGAGSFLRAGDYSFIDYFLTRHIDPHGNVTTVNYSNTGYGQALPLTIVDYDGLTNTLSYNQFNSTNDLFVLTNIAGPYGQNVQLRYDGLGNLTNIVDAQGLHSRLTYDSNGYPTSLVTPYGTNVFALYVNGNVLSTNDTEGNFGGDTGFVDRAAQVTDPDGGTHLYLYRNDCSEFMATNFASTDVPTNTPLGTLDTGGNESPPLDAACFRNSFAWDPRQHGALSTNNYASFAPSDFLRGRMKHWLEDTNDLSVSGYLSVERDPSPDGTTEGLKVFYDYQGKAYPQRVGTNALPSVKAWRLPGGETHYEYVQFDYFGNITNQITTYTTASGALATRTNQLLYSDNTYTNIFYYPYTSGYAPFSTNTFTVPDLLTKVIDANGSNVWTFGQFDTVTWTNFFYWIQANQTNEIVSSYVRVVPDRVTNGLGEVAVFALTGPDRVTEVQWPSGLTTTNVYNSSNFLTQTIDLQIHRTNSFAYSTNGLPSVWTNALGLPVNLSWDNLLRLTSVSFPDSTTISNVYTNLDLGARKDRLGHWTYFGYDRLQHLTSITNANTNVTRFDWCGCGALTGIMDALSNTVTLNYDNQERLTNVAFPDTSSLNYQYDLAGQMTNAFDGLNRSIQLVYNNQGLATNLSNANGLLWRRVFDILDRPTSITDANGITVTNNFDALNRILTRTWLADAVSESFGYATNGLIAYTNRDGKTTYYGRDTAGRLTSLTNANTNVTQFGYNALDEITNLVDGLTHSTVWHYNQFGWVTNKVDALTNVAFVYAYDANGRLTNRWTPTSTNTSYFYDPVGNLTNITYAGSSPATNRYAYDALNRLTNMIDAIGTTAFTYTQVGRLASESNPFSGLSGAISYSYTQGQRTGLTLTLITGNWTQSYGYDSGWRLNSLTSPAGTFAYGYAASASALVQSIGLPNAAYIANGYDSLARMTNTALLNRWGHVVDGYGYGYDHWGLRTNVVRNLGLTTNSVAVGYDNIGQLISWTAQESGSAARLNEQLGYGFDASGNLENRTNGFLIQTFNSDALNQLSTVTRSGPLTLTGATPAPATYVMVNGSSAQTYGDLTFARTNISLSNGANTFTIIAHNTEGLAVTNVMGVNLPATNVFQYDGNGNLTNDGTRSFAYDGENQLTNVFVTGQWRTDLLYDGLRRRRITREYSWTGSSWLQTNETRLLYDGMLPIQERDSNNTPQVTYTRGLDLSGNIHGAGGIGGLLARTDGNGSTFYHSDGEGNITALMDANGNVVARYEYDPFGRLIGKSGPMADGNVYRFSSKEYQRATGLYAYGFRFYEPNFQRWVNRDPIQEWGGINLYGFVNNNPVNAMDLLGLDYDPDSYYGIYHAPQNTPVTAPSFLESLVPVYGPMAQSEYDFSQGNWGWGFANGALAVSDTIPLRSAANAFSKGAWKFGSHTWDATRKWLTKCGWRQFRGQQMHHWAIPQGGWGKYLPNWLKNQPWNLMGMPDAAFHGGLHGVGPEAFDFGERLWYGTPNWLAAGMGSVAGREANWMFNDGASENAVNSPSSYVLQH
jgi:RHS repeat-associated protein